MRANFWSNATSRTVEGILNRQFVSLRRALGSRVAELAFYFLDFRARWADRRDAWCVVRGGTGKIKLSHPFALESSAYRNER